MSDIFELIFKSGNKSGNSILRAFPDSGIDIVEGGEYMNDSAWIWPSSDMDFWKIDKKETSVKIRARLRNPLQSVKTVRYSYKTEEVVYDGTTTK